MSRRWLRSPAELAGRGVQALRIGLERAGIGPAGTVPTSADLCPSLPFAAPDPVALAGIYRQRPDERRLLLAHADAALAGHFKLLGFSDLAFGFPPDWHADPTRHTRAPLIHWSRVPYLDEATVGDHKIIWEVNRHQWLVTLAQAAVLTQDPRYPLAISSALQDWLDANPPRQGVNWASSLELALRVVSWTWTLHLLQGRIPDADRIAPLLLSSLDLHGRQIERFLSTWFAPNTHLTGEALGLLYLGVAWPDLPRAARWRRLGWQILLEQLPLQVRADGTYFEQASWYQGYTADFYLHALMLARAARLAVPAKATQRIERCVKVLAQLLRPDGTLPLLGDDDGGRLLPLDPERGRFNDTMALAAHVSQRPSYCSSRRVPAGVAWIIANPAWRALTALREPDSEPASVGFPEGGMYVLRGAEGAMVVDAGPHGSLAGGHSHADALSFDLTVEGQAVLVDPGTGAYVGRWRNDFRATASHNTLVLADGTGSARPAGAFRWGRWPRSTVTCWRSGRGWAVLQAEHDGFHRVAKGLTHRRTILYRTGLGWLVLDQLLGPAAAAEVRFQLDSGLTVHREGRTLEIRHASRTLLHMVSDSGDAIRMESGLVSHCYGSVDEAPRLIRHLIAGEAAAGAASALSTTSEVHLERVTTEATTMWSWASPGLSVEVELSPTGGLMVRGDDLNLELH